MQYLTCLRNWKIGNIPMLAEYHASPDDRELSLPLETNSTKFETSHFSVQQENLQNNKHELRNFQTILKHIRNINFYSKKRKEMLSYIKTEFEHTLPSTDINVLQDYLHSLHNNNSLFLLKDKQSTCLFSLIAYHVLVASENENSTPFLKVIKDKLIRLRTNGFHFYLDCIFQLYLDVYYKNNPNEVFTNIHTIWKSDKATELNLKLAYCRNLIEAKDNKILKQLIHNHADNLIESFEENEHQLCINSSTAAMVLLHILHHQVSINKMEKVKTIKTILSRKRMGYRHNKTHLMNGFSDFLLTLDKKQLRCAPYVIKLLHSLMKEQPLDLYLKIILLCSNRLSQANHYTERIKFIKCHFKLISSFPTDMLKTQGCYYRQQYCIALLLLLNEFISCHDIYNINLVLTKLLELRISFLSDVSGYTCYCFMGKKECSTKRKENVQDSIYHGVPILETEFKKELLHYYKRRLHSMKRRKYSPFREKGIWSSHTGSVYKLYEIYDFDLVMDDVMQGKLELAPYLQSIIDIMSKNIYKNESVVFLIGFIKRFADHNEASLYTLVKMLCALDLQPEVQDVVLQGLNAYLMISCNRQYGILSKFILDISMICPKGQFLHKLTSGIATLSLKFDDDTVNDFRKIIYKCYCTVRHDSKNDKDTNITKYKDHYSFIASMQSEDEMKKLTNLTNFLLMLTLLLIASGGHHKSAELKKYLSLKYEYRDSILYLLWCSGDVEINPGPTLRTLRKVPDSVKKRNWIYEMCAVLLRLLIYKSFGIKNGGMYKVKPLHWPTDRPLYDPRNKPKGQGYNIDTDKTLLAHLIEYCYKEGIFNDSTQVDDKSPKIQLKQYQKEIIAWQNDKTELFALYIFRQIQDTLKEAKESLHKYRDDPEFQQHLNDLDLILIFDSGKVSNVSNQNYTDMLRDIAITLCRIAKRLNILEKSDGIWKTKPIGWNPNHPFYSPCNAGKGKKKDQYKQLVNNLLAYCESKNITIPSELQRLLKAWKQKKTSEITKSYTIWSKTAIVKHSLQFLELEGLLGKIHVQESLKQIGVILDTQHWRCPSVNVSCTSDNDDKSQDSGSSDNLPSSNSSDKETNSTAKIASIQINSDNPSTQLSNSTQTNTKDTPASPLSLVCHTDGHLCNVAPDQQYQRNQSSKYTCVNSFKDSCPILASEAQPEADGNYQPISISSVNSSTSKGEVIPCTVHIHDATSKTDSNNNISKTAKKRGKQKNDESPTEPKRLHISEEDDPLLLNILISPSENGKVLPNTKQKDGAIRPISPYQFPHDLISTQSRLNPSAAKKQTDQLVVKDLTDIASDKPKDPSLPKSQDGEINKANKNNKTTSDQYDGKIVDLVEELDQYYSSAVVQQTIPISCSSTDQSSDSSDELPEPIKLCVDTYLNSYNPDDTLETDIEQFIEEQGMDSS